MGSRTPFKTQLRMTSKIFQARIRNGKNILESEWDLPSESKKKKWKRHPHFDAVIHNTSCSIATNANNPFSPSLSSAAPLWPYPAFLPDSVRRPVLLPCALLLVQPSHRQWQAWCRFQQCHLDLDVSKPLVLAGGQGSIARPVHPGV